MAADPDDGVEPWMRQLEDLQERQGRVAVTDDENSAVHYDGSIDVLLHLTPREADALVILCERLEWLERAGCPAPGSWVAMASFNGHERCSLLGTIEAIELALQEHGIASGS